MKITSVLFGLLCLLSTVSWSNEAAVPLMPPQVSLDPLLLQKGAKLFVNYCLGCHSLSAIRYRQFQDFGVSEKDIKKYLLPEGGKVTDNILTFLSSADAKKWFGIIPPDLSLVSRSRGNAWIYTFLHSFYVDRTRPTQWNNLLFPATSMPHVLGALQGERTLRKIEGESNIEEHDSVVYAKKTTIFPAHGDKELQIEKLSSPLLWSPQFYFSTANNGILSPEGYSEAVRALVSFLSYVGEPYRRTRILVGLCVFVVLSVLAVLTYLLKKEYWKDIH